MNWQDFMDTRFESGLPTDVRQLPEGDELELIERSICALQLVKGSEESARTISWRHAQKAEPVAPPVPRKPSRHVPVDPTKPPLPIKDEPRKDLRSSSRWPRR